MNNTLALNYGTGDRNSVKNKELNSISFCNWISNKCIIYYNNYHINWMISV